MGTIFASVILVIDTKENSFFILRLFRNIHGFIVLTPILMGIPSRLKKYLRVSFFFAFGIRKQE